MPMPATEEYLCHHLGTVRQRQLPVIKRMLLVTFAYKSKLIVQLISEFLFPCENYVTARGKPQIIVLIKSSDLFFKGQFGM